MPNAFLITYKPVTENPGQGWPIENLKQLVAQLQGAESVRELWRFSNRKEVRIGDRVFLLLQGKQGPAIIGYGNVADVHENAAAKRQVPIEFKQLVDPTIQILVNRSQLLGIRDGQRFWRTQSSGVLLSARVSAELERLAIRATPTAPNTASAGSPDWSRDELILALDVYLRHRPNLPGRDAPDIIRVSEILNRLGRQLFSPEQRPDTFRNANSVYMKLMNFCRLDPQYTSHGRKGLTRGAKAEEDVWAEYSGDPGRCELVANAIISTLDAAGTIQDWLTAEFDEGIQEAPEGRVLTRMHVARERNRQLGDSKRRQALKRHGKLECEVCRFNFADRYGDRGSGFIECHHIKPIATLAEGHKTHLDDLALVCANCHRMIHARKPWLSVADLRALIGK